MEPNFSTNFNSFHAITFNSYPFLASPRWSIQTQHLDLNSFECSSNVSRINLVSRRIYLVSSNADPMFPRLTYFALSHPLLFHPITPQPMLFHAKSISSKHIPANPDKTSAYLIYSKDFHARK